VIKSILRSIFEVYFGSDRPSGELSHTTSPLLFDTFEIYSYNSTSLCEHNTNRFNNSNGTGSIGEEPSIRWGVSAGRVTPTVALGNIANERTVFDIRSVLNSNGKSTLEELEWASDYLSEKIEKVSLLIENLCKQIEHVSDKKDKKKIKNLEKTLLRKTERTSRDTFQQQQGQVLNWISQNITGQTLASDSSSDSSDDEESVGANVPPS
jgi:hypothetical protein